MSRSKKISLDEEVLKSRVFSEACNSSLKVMAIVCELAAEGGFSSLDAAYEHCPRVVEIYCDTARAALRALKKLEDREKDRKSAMI